MDSSAGTNDAPTPIIKETIITGQHNKKTALLKKSGNRPGYCKRIR